MLSDHFTGWLPEFVESRIHDCIEDRPERETDTDRPAESIGGGECPLSGEHVVIARVTARQKELILYLGGVGAELQREAARQA